MIAKLKMLLLFSRCKKKEDVPAIKELEDKIVSRKVVLYEMEDALPKQNGNYLKIILGNVNVSILNRDDK